MKATLKRILWDVVIGLVVFGITAPVSYLLGRESLANEVTDALRILGVDDTTTALGSIVEECNRSIGRFEEVATSPALNELQDSVESLGQAVNAVQVTKYYSVEELKKLAEGEGAHSEITLFGSRTSYERFIDEHMNKPKEVVAGLPSVHNAMDALRQSLRALKGESDESSVAPDVLRVLTKIRDNARSAEASTRARQDTLIETLARFGRKG